MNNFEYYFNGVKILCCTFIDHKIKKLIIYNTFGEIVFDSYSLDKLNNKIYYEILEFKENSFVIKIHNRYGKIIEVRFN